jgi:hypothetical protein
MPFEPRSGQGRRQQLCRDPLATRHQQILQARIRVAEHGRRRAQVEILADEPVNGPLQCPLRCAGPKHRARGLDVLALEGKPRLRRALQQQIGDAGEGRGHHHERSAMRGDLLRGFLDGAPIRERRAAELPDFELHLLSP